MGNQKVALITGGNKGIGKAISLRLAEDGFNIIIIYSSSDIAAKEVQKEVIECGSECHIIQLDVSQFEEANEKLNEAFNIYGRIDVLVNNAGITKDQLMLRMSESDFDDVINVNLKGTFNCIKGINKRLLKQREGKIINISSVIGKMGNIGQCNYAASKAGIIGLTKSLAKEFAKRNIQVNAVAPGFIETDMTKALAEDVKEAMLEYIPAQCFGKPEDVANVVAFLASKQADYITGQVIAVDGGMTY